VAKACSAYEQIEPKVSFKYITEIKELRKVNVQVPCEIEVCARMSLKGRNPGCCHLPADAVLVFTGVMKNPGGLSSNSRMVQSKWLLVSWFTANCRNVGYTWLNIPAYFNPPAKHFTVTLVE
jgi:hypothetical protein